MEESANYSKQERGDIFELVNSQYLNLQGRKKAISKRQFTTVWKADNKTLSAYDLMIALYKSEEINNKQTEAMEKYFEDNGMSIDEVKNKRPVPYAKHIKRMRYKDEQIEELQNELDNVLEDNNLMSKEDHLKEIQEIKQEMREHIDIRNDRILKLETQLNFAKEDAEAKLRIANEKNKYLEEQLKLLSS